jgi:hypothetical protein
MTDHIVLLSDAESRRLATGTLFVVRPVVPQPKQRRRIAPPSKVSDWVPGLPNVKEKR